MHYVRTFSIHCGVLFYCKKGTDMVLKDSTFQKNGFAQISVEPLFSYVVGK